MGKDRNGQRQRGWPEWAVTGVFVALCAVMLVSPLGKWILLTGLAVLALGALLFGGVIVVSLADGVWQYVARQRRFRTGHVEAVDVLHYAYRCCGGRRLWPRRNIRSSVSQGNLFAIRDAMAETAHNGHHSVHYSPACLYRWLRDEDQPMLLARVMRAGIPEADLLAYMDGDDADREAFEFLLGLRLEPQQST